MADFSEPSSSLSNTSSFNWNALSNIITTVSNGVFGFFGKKEDTKQLKIENDTEEFIAELNTNVKIRENELKASQKKETISSITKVAIVFGGLFFLGFVLYLVFKRSDKPQVPVQAAVQAPIPLA
ncbi:hypothetical protein [Runella slithyformis]|uniref:Uncharacterized protein n=1 Tax=Runella slithyformis (strain ATCC 29530 / DSM 19594 / LMG 11500 / NCIMB 11436 / LSU 4) TaxID=761193 RepID=A0A7U4E7Y2_RUNSL|nr:hypothetical protein [Runella slithyformis]AEI50669.1 hypothetical protein Runsl_4331 [Runella slithyformis DSM 19594]